MKIWHKILVAPAVAILFLVAFGVLTYFVMQRQAESLEELATTRRAGVEAATDAAQKVSAVHAGVYRLFTWRANISEESIKQAAEQLSEKVADVNGYLTGFRAQPHILPEEKLHLDAVVQKLGEYRSSIQEAIERSTDAASAAGLMAGADTTFQSMLQSLSALAEMEKKLAQESYEQATAASNQAMLFLLAILGLAVVSSVVIAILTARAIVRPLNRAIGTAQQIARGDLSVDVRVVGRDETAELLQALSAMTRNLRDLVGEVASGAHTVADTSSQIAQGNLDLSQRTEEQASTLEETASSMEELTATVTQNAQNARQASELAASASEVANRGGEVVGRVVHTMTGISESSRKIGDIIGVIDGIAFQTNILALNAAVEAARAGEQGRGFAVVASEVRTLAQRSAAAAKEIKGLIGESVNKVDAGTKMVDAAGATMRDIVDSVRRVSELIAEIAAASQEQSVGIGQVNTAVVHMEQVVQQNASLVEEATAATESMKAQAGTLLQLLERFHLGGAKPTSLEPLQAGARERPVQQVAQGYTPALAGDPQTRLLGA
jgi:methyl-accepting chemotaxis protein